jgi:hypothetical protein
MVTTDFNKDGENELLIGDAKGFLSLWIRNPAKPGIIEYIPDIDTLIKKEDQNGYLGLWPNPFAMDYDEDGDTDVLCGYENGSTMGQSIFLFRMTGGIAGSNPIYGSLPAGLSGKTGTAPIPDISISPNPFNQKTLVKLPFSSSGGRLTIYNASGRIAWTRSLSKCKKFTLNTGRLPSGLYTLRAETDRGCYNKRIVIIK